MLSEVGEIEPTRFEGLVESSEGTGVEEGDSTVGVVEGSTTGCAAAVLEVAVGKGTVNAGGIMTEEKEFGEKVDCGSANELVDPDSVKRVDRM